MQRVWKCESMVQKIQTLTAMIKTNATRRDRSKQRGVQRPGKYR